MTYDVCPYYLNKACPSFDGHYFAFLYLFHDPVSRLYHNLVVALRVGQSLVVLLLAGSVMGQVADAGVWILSLGASFVLLVEDSDYYLVCAHCNT